MRGSLLVALLLFVSCGETTRSNARPIVVVAANESFNWSGYVQGALEKNTTFHAISGEWVVPKAKQRRVGEAEYSSTWIGIGGGCLDTSCTLTDATLIQAGIDQDVDAAGNADYYAWWETIPAPSVRIPDLLVRAGDRVRVTIVESPLTPGVWTIAISDLSTGDPFSITLPYPSTYGSAEWILETPVAVSNSGAVTVGPMPDLSVVGFDAATANGVSPGFVVDEEMRLVDFDLSLIALPSAPDRGGDGFNDCTFRKTCHVPGGGPH